MIPFEKLSDIFELGIIDVDSKGRILELNEAAKSVFGPGADWSKILIFQICPEWSIKKLRQIHDHLVTVETQARTLEYIDYDGNFFDAKTLLFRIKENGNIRLIFNRTGAGSDQLMEIIRTSIDQIDEMIFWLRPDGSMAYLNFTAFEQLGYTEAELIDKSIGLIDLHLGFEEYIKIFSQLSKNKHSELESQFTTKDGSNIPVNISCNYVEYRQLAFNCLVAKNITRTQSIMRDLEEVKYALDHVNLACLWNDFQGNIVYANQAACRMYGYSFEEISRLHISALNQSVSEAQLKEYISEIANQSDWSMESEHTRKDGSVFPVEVTGSRIKTGVREINMLFITNITHVREQSLKNQRLLESISQLKDKLKEENEYLIGEITERNSFEHIISVSPAYKTVLHKVQQVAETDSTVLITGETGTGKELLARAIHRMSLRSDHPLIRINSSTLPKDLIESELFGHKKGAFTGAFNDRKGRFEMADGGTVFLDEIGELPLLLQPKLLRVLQEGEFERLGDTQTLKVDVRIIAATNRHLMREVKQKRFREDLYYRLNVFPIHNLPLRERREDIPVLVHHFVEKYCQKIGKPILKVKKSTISGLMRYAFPGNIRELENIIERSVILSAGLTLKLDLNLLTTDPTDYNEDDFLSFDDMQKEYIIEALNKCRWKVTGPNSAAELLGLNGKTLMSKMRKFQITR